MHSIIHQILQVSQVVSVDWNTKWWFKVKSESVEYVLAAFVILYCVQSLLVTKVAMI